MIHEGFIFYSSGFGHSNFIMIIDVLDVFHVVTVAMLLGYTINAE